MTAAAAAARVGQAAASLGGARRRAAGGLFLLLGLSLVGFAGVDYGRGVVARSRARTAWDAVEARRAVAAARASMDVVERVLPPALGSPVARLLIPSIGLDEVVVEGTSTRELRAGPGHVVGSAFPGEPGNAVVSAHRDRHFAQFGRLKLGDTVRTETERGVTAWVIVGRRTVAADAPALFHTDDATLTLTTCWPIRWFGSAPERLLLTAKPVAPAVANRSW